MIPGDEGKPMSILERISDEPCDPEPYVEYLLANARGRLEYWQGVSNDRDPEKPTAKECVCCQLTYFVMDLESILRKMRRPHADPPVVATPAPSEGDPT